LTYNIRARTRALTRRVYVYSFLDEFIPLYAVYVLMFQDSGLTLSEITVMFAVWTITGFVAEIPTGVIADKMPRHLLVAIAAGLRGVGFALWSLVPSFAGYTVGFVLWGISTAFTSGAWQALVYTELGALGASERYVKVMGLSAMLGNIAVTSSMVFTPILMGVGGYQLTGWISALACFLSIPMLLTIPHKTANEKSDDTETPAEYVTGLRDGLTEIQGNGTLVRLLLVVAALTTVVNFDEYMPLQARAAGVSTNYVSLLMLIPWAAMSLGGAAVAKWSSVTPRTIGVLLGVSVVLFAAGSLSENVIGFVGIGVFYAMYRFTFVLAEARLQDSIEGRSRATIGSVAGFGSQVFTLGFFGFFGIGGNWFSVPQLMSLMSVPMLALAVVVARWLPKQTTLTQQREVS
jgi:MFS family permease